MRIAITGATGFIGQQCGAYLCERAMRWIACGRRGWACHGLAQHGRAHNSVPACDILDAASVHAFMRDVRPTHLLHLAWFTGQNYAHDPINTAWLEASKELLRSFIECGGRRFVGVGTCFEYALHGELCAEQERERVGAPAPHTAYGVAKHAFYEYLRTLALSNALSWAWCRPFYVFGAQEPSHRLVPSAARAFARGENFMTAAYYRCMDYIDVCDVAHILVTILLGDFCGAVNVGTGRGLMVQDMLAILAEKYNISGAAPVRAVPASPWDVTPHIVADTRVMQGIVPRFSFKTVNETLNDYCEVYR